MDGSRALQGAPGVLGGVFLEALEVSRGAFWMIFLGLGGTGRENGEMLESDDHLNENAMFRGSQGPQNVTNVLLFSLLCSCSSPRPISAQFWSHFGTLGTSNT